MNFEDIKNIFSAIEKYNGLDINAQKEFTEEITKTNKGLGSYLSGLNNANATFKGYVGTLTTATIKTVGLKIATAALTSTLTMGATVAISGIVTSIMDWINKTEKLIEESKEAIQKIGTIRDELKESQETISNIGEKYANLAQGVNQLTGENISLNTEEYEEFLALSNQLAKMFPTLTRNYNDNGDAIVQLSGDVDTIVGSLQNLIEIERDFSNKEIIENLPKAFEGVAEISKGYDKELENLKKQNNALKTFFESEEFSSNFIDGVANGWVEISDKDSEKLFKIRDEYLELLDILNIDYEELTATTEMIDGVEVPVSIAIKLNSDYSSDPTKILSDFYEEVAEQIELTNKKNKENWSSLSSSIYAWLSTEDSFKVMDDSMQAAVQNIVNGLDWSNLNFDSWKKAKQYIQDNILSLFNTSEGKETLKNIELMFDLKTQFNNNEITVGEYQSKINNFLTQIEDLPFETKKSILLLFGIKMDEDDSVSSDTDTMIKKVQNKLKGDKFDNKVIDLKLEDLKIASELQVEDDTILSWDELIQKIEETKKVSKTYTPFSEVFNATDFAEHKEKLLELAKAGELTPETLRSTKEYDTLLSETGLYANEAVKEINALVDATSRLSDMSSDLDSLSIAYKEFKEDGYVNIESIEALREKFGNLKDENGNDLFEEFANVVGSSKTDPGEKQKYFNKLATSYLIAENALSKLTESNKDYYVTQLQAMGIANAQTIVNKLLTGKQEALNLATKNGYETAEEYSSQLWSNEEALTEFKTASEECKKYLGELRLEEIKFNNQKLDTSQRIKVLQELAKAYNFDTGKVKYFYKEEKVEGAPDGAISVVVDWDKTWENYSAEFDKQWNARFNAEYQNTDYKGSDKDSSNSSTKETEANFDWIETKIEHLSSKAEKEAKKATDSIFAYVSKKYKKSHLNQAISTSQEAITAAKDGRDYYIKERNKIGLPKVWAEKVENGAIDIDVLKGTENETLIKQIEDYQELTDKINGCTTTIEDLVFNIQEYAEQLANLPIEEAEKKIDKYNNKTDILSAKYDNLNSYKDKNKNLDSQYDYAKKETKARKSAMDEANTNALGAFGGLSKYASQGIFIGANKGKKFGDEFSTKGLEVGSEAYNAVLKYNEAIKASTQTEIDHALAVENETKILRENTRTKYDNVTAYRESLRSVREAQVSKAQAYLDYRDAKGWSNTSDGEKEVYQDMLTGQKQVLGNYQEERKKYNQATLDKQYKQGKLSFEDYKALSAYIVQLDENILKAKTDIIATEKVLNEFKLTSLGYQITDAQSKIDKFSNDLALREKKWGEKVITKEDYNSQLSSNKSLITLYQNQNKELTKLRDKTTKYSDLWFEYQEQIDANNSSINDLQMSNEDLMDSIRELDFSDFEDAHKSVEKTITSIETLISLINDDSLFSSEGALTNLGTAKFSILAKELKQGKDDIQTFIDEIDEKNKKHQKHIENRKKGIYDAYSNEEYEKDMEEAMSGLYNALSKNKSITDAIISMHTQQQQIIIDALKEEISARSEALQKKKEYYDYDKQIRTKTKDIEALEAQKAALEVTEDSLEKRRKLVELEAELTKQREELEETQKDHEINLVVNGLNDFSNDIQERFDDYTKKLSSSFDEQIKIIQNANKMYTTGFNSMAKTFNEVLSFYGVDTTAVNFKSLPGFATGGVIGGTSYNGDKLIARVNSGESILTQDFTELLPHAVNVMQDLTKATAPNLNHLVKVQPAINVSYDNLINIEGNATNETIVELKKLMPTITKQVTKSIKDDMKKSGY